MAAGNVADGHAWLHPLGYDRQFLLGREAPSAGDARDDFYSGERVGHRLGPRSVPGSPC